MKEHWRLSKGNLISAEEGLKFAEPVTGRSICSCDRLIQFMKLVLYVELILFLGWSSYTLWQVYDCRADSTLFNVFRSNRGPESTPNGVSESIPNVPNEPSTLSPFNDFREQTHEIRITEEDPPKENVFTPPNSTHVGVNITSEWYEDENAILLPPIESLHLFESSKSDEDDETMVKVTNIGDEPKDNENSDSLSEFFRLLRQMHRDLDVSHRDEALKRFHDSTEEKEESNDVSESRRTLSDMFTKNKDNTNEEEEEEESDSGSEDVPSSAEIFNNLKKLYESIETARVDLHLKDLDYDEPYWWRPSTPKQVNVEVPSFSEEDTKSSIVFPENSNTEESYFHPSLLYPHRGYTAQTTLSSKDVESDNSDSSKETTSDSTSESWHSFVNWRGWYNSMESTEKDTTYQETSTRSTHDDDTDTFWKKFQGSSNDESDDDSAISSQSENVEMEKWPVLCRIQYIYGLKTIQCSPNLVGTTDRSSDSSLSTDSKSDDEFSFPGKVWSVDQIATNKSIPIDGDSSNEKSNIFDDDTIDIIEKESIETSTGSVDLYVTSENSKADSFDFPTYWMMEDTTQPSSSQDNWNSDEQSYLDEYY